MEPVEFVRSIRTFAPHIEHYFSPDEIDATTGEHKNLIRSYRTEKALQRALDALDDSASWDTSWSLLFHSFSKFADYCGRPARGFRGTATVERDLSLLCCEKNKHRKALSGFGLEGVLQCKQFARLPTLSEA